MTDVPTGAPLELAQLREKQALGSSAIYQIIGLEATLVLVEVVEAPGLAPGLTLRLTADDVQAMTALGPAEVARARERQPIAA